MAKLENDMTREEATDVLEEMQETNLAIMHAALQAIFANMNEVMPDAKNEDRLYALLASFDIATLRTLREQGVGSPQEARTLIGGMYNDGVEANAKFMAKYAEKNN